MPKCSGLTSWYKLIVTEICVVEHERIADMRLWLLSDAVFMFPDTQPLSLGLGGGQSRTSWITMRWGLIPKHCIDLTELKINVCISQSSWILSLDQRILIYTNPFGCIFGNMRKNNILSQISKYVLDETFLRTFLRKAANLFHPVLT